MPDLPTDDAILYDLVCPAIVGSKYLLETMQLARAQGRSTPEKDAAALTILIHQLATAADVLHAWYVAKHVAPPQGE